MARPVSRRRYLGTHVALLVPGCALVALAYALGALAGDRTFDAPGAPLQLSRMLLAALESALLLLAIGTLAVLVSAYSSERGRALAWVLGIAIGMYAANFLLVLWEPTRDLARLTFFWYFSPGATIQRGDVAWGDGPSGRVERRRLARRRCGTSSEEISSSGRARDVAPAPASNRVAAAVRRESVAPDVAARDAVHPHRDRCRRRPRRPPTHRRAATQRARRARLRARDASRRRRSETHPSTGISGWSTLPAKSRHGIVTVRGCRATPARTGSSAIAARSARAAASDAGTWSASPRRPPRRARIAVRSLVVECPACGETIESVMQVDCRACGTPLSPAELFGTTIRRKAEPARTPLADDGD